MGTNGIAEAERTGREEGAGRVRLKWRTNYGLRESCEAVTSSGAWALIQFEISDPLRPWRASVKGTQRVFETKEEAQLYCESVLTGLLLRDLGSVLGENWTDAPGKSRLRVVTDIEVDDVTGEPEARGGHSFVLDRNTQQIRRMHDEECATNKGKPCVCFAQQTVSVEVGVTRE